VNPVPDPLLEFRNSETAKIQSDVHPQREKRVSRVAVIFSSKLFVRATYCLTQKHANWRALTSILIVVYFSRGEKRGHSLEI
jgi:predicted secreted protein